MSSEGVIKLKGDNSQLDSATEKSKLNFEKLGQHASKANHHAKTFGEQWMHANASMLRTVAHGSSIVAVLERAVEFMTELQTKAKEASKAVGSIAVSRDIAANKLGFSNEEAAGITGGASPVSLEDRTKFFSGLADRKFGRGKSPLTKEQAARVQQAYNSGLYSESEISQAVESGDLSKLMQSGAREAGLSRESRAARATDIYVNQQRDTAEEARAHSGNLYRAAEASFDRQAAENPFGVASIGGSLDLGPLKVGTVAKGLYGIQAALGVGRNEASGLKAQLEEQTNIMEREARRPTVGKPAE